MGKKALWVAFVFLSLLGLYFVSLSRYPLFHGLTEIISIVIAYCIFIIAWNSRQTLDNNYLLLLGIAFFFVGTFDLFHLVALQGTGLFVEREINLSNQIWISSRLIQGISFLLAPLVLNRRLNLPYLLAAYLTATLVLFGALFLGDFFPPAYTAQAGFTPFMKASEFLIILLLAASLVMLLRVRETFDSTVALFLILSLILTLANEIAFSLETGSNGLFNRLGHYFELLSDYFIYKALVETGLKRPYDLLFRNLKQSEASLQRANEALEGRVAERTDALKHSAEQLRLLSAQLLQAQELERKRLAREIHDGLGQLLTLIKFRLENVVLELQRRGANQDALALEELSPVIQASIEETRRIQMDLRPSILDDLGILAALQWFCREFQKTYPDLRIIREMDLEEDDIPVFLRTALYRISQEALNNIAKHSRADTVQLTLKRSADRLELQIRDNGRGFEPEAVRSPEDSPGGLGLSSMRERAELSGGRFRIQTAPGRGTTLQVSWPVKE